MRTAVTIFVLLASNIIVASEAVKTVVFNENNIENSSKKIYAGDQIVVKNTSGLVMLNSVATETIYFEPKTIANSFKDGFYTLEVIKPVMINIVPFQIKDGAVLLDLRKEDSFFKPITRIKDNLIYVNQLSLKESPLEIELYFDPEYDGGWAYQLIHFEKIDSTVKIGRIYELDKKQAGRYKLVLTSEGRTFVEKFTL